MEEEEIQHSCKESINSIRISELEKRLALHVDYQQNAVEVATKELHVRLESMNEFRQQIKDQTALFLTRNEFNLHHEAFGARIIRLEQIVATRYNREEIDARLKVITDKISDLETSKAMTAGKWWAVSAIVTFLSAFGAILINFLLKMFHIGN